MKKKRFYKNIKRGSKWTEEENGYPIDFADKYISDEGIYTDKFDYMRPKTKKKKRTKEKAKSHSKRLGIALLCLLIIGCGYTGMDVYMQRHGMPVKYSEIQNRQTGGSINEMQLNLTASYEESISMDGSIMLDSVISKLTEGGYNGVMIDIKRDDGSVGFKNALATVDTYGSVAFPATDLKGSVSKLKEQDLLTVGRVYCYMDNLVPKKDRSTAILDSNGIPYTDKKGNTYLNPDSQTAYKYIKDIIAEAAEAGITVFVLEGTDLPDAIASQYSGGFEKLAAKLYDDLGTDIKFVKGIDVSVSASDIGISEAEEVSEEKSEKHKAEKEESSEEKEETESTTQNKINELLPPLDNSKEVYFITTAADKAETKSVLDECGISSYILAN